ncbi:hypothetical protein D1872_37800 [compost metagenome]
MNMVTTINQLTRSNHTSDPRFETVIDVHYEKFRYFYELLQGTHELVKDMECSEDRRVLQVKLLPIQTTHLQEIQTIVEDNIVTSNEMQQTYFNVNISKEKKSLNITIECKSIVEECEIYGIGPDTY